MFASKFKRSLVSFGGILCVLLTAVFVGSSVSSGDVQEVTAESYWYHDALGRLVDVSETETYLVGQLHGHHGLIPFRVRKDEVARPEPKSRGYKRVVEEMLAWLKTSAKDFARSKLEDITGEQLTELAEWEAWFRENAGYLVWSEQEQRLIIDIDVKAKNAGVPKEDGQRSTVDRR